MRSTTGRYRVMLALVGVIALAVLAGAVVLWPRGELALPATAGQADSTRFVSATLTKVVRLDCEEADPGVPGSVCIKVTAQLAGGRQVTLDTTDPTGGMFRAGQRVSLAVSEQPGLPTSYSIQDLERGRRRRAGFSETTCCCPIRQEENHRVSLGMITIITCRCHPGWHWHRTGRSLHRCARRRAAIGPCWRWSG